MNRNIEIRYPIDKERLDKENFFLSLMNKLDKNNIIPIERLEVIQMQTLEILKEELKYFTKGESTSVRVEVAESILSSIYYIIGYYFKELENIMESVEILKTTDIKEIYKEGKKTIEKLFLKTKKLKESVNKNKLTTKNYGYNSTITEGIDMFFKEYNMRFSAHIAPCSIDYPLFIGEINLVGVEYIYEYLKVINIENKFCLYFNNEEIEKLLDNYDDECEQLLINIFIMVLRNSIGSVLAGKCVQNLELSKEDIKYIESKLKGNDSLNIINEVIMKCLVDLNIKDEYIREYVINSSMEIALDIDNALELNKLEKVFIEVKERNEKIVYVDRKSMEDERFRSVIENIKDCRFIDEKIAIIRKEIKSLKDLADMLEADCIFENEFIDFFKCLEDMELALLLKYSGVPIYNLKYKDFHRIWHNRLYDFIFSLDDNKKEEVLNLYNDIEC